MSRPHKTGKWGPIVGLLAVAAISLAGPRLQREPAPDSPSHASVLRVTARGRPIAGASLRSWSATDGWTLQSESDDDGYFPPTPLGTSDAMQSYVTAPGWARQRVTGLEVQLERAMPLAGVVLDIAGEPVAATLQVWRIAPESAGEAHASDAMAVLREPNAFGNNDERQEADEPTGSDSLAEPEAPARAQLTLIAEAPFETEADAEGVFSFEDVPGGPVRLVISAPGYAREVVMPGTGRHAVHVVLTPAATLAGVVRNAEGHPARDAEVIVAGSGFWPPRHYTTDDDGRFRVDDAPPGIYETWARSGSQRSPTRAGIQLEIGDSEFVTLAMVEGEEIRGRVVNSLGEGIADVELLLTGGGNSLTPIHARTDPAGRFVLEGLLPVPFSRTLLARIESYLPAELRFEGPQDDVEIVLQRGATLRGWVVDDRGRGVEGATVRWSMSPSHGAAQRDSSSVGHADLHNLGVMVGPVPPIPYADSPAVLRGYGDATTAADGSFVLSAVLPGQGQLSASHPDYASANPTELTVVESETRSELRLRVRDGGVLYGRVVDVRGFPVGNLPVELATDDRTIPSYTMVGEDGAFEFRGVLGAVTLTARPYDAPAARQSFFVNAGQQREVTLTLESALGALSGRIRDEHGFLVDDAELRLTSVRDETPFERQTRAEPDGSFSFVALPPPPYSLVVDAPGFALLELEVLPSHDPTRSLSLTLMPGVNVVGHVVDEWNGSSIIGARVSLFPAGQDPGGGGEPSLVTHSATEGRFGFTRLPAGRYTLLAEYEGRTLQSDVELQGPLMRLAPLSLPAAGRIAVTVVDALGDPAPGTQVNAGNQNAATGNSGIARLLGLAPGLYVVSARHDQAGQAEGIRVRVDAAETSDVRLTLNGRMPLGGGAQVGPGVSSLGEENSTPDPAASSGSPRMGVAVRIERSGMQVIIAAVARGSLAHRAGLRAGDVLLQIEGEAVLSAGTARAQLRGPGGRVRLLVERNGRRIRRTVQRESYVLD